MIWLNIFRLLKSLFVYITLYIQDSTLNNNRCENRNWQNQYNKQFFLTVFIHNIFIERKLGWKFISAYIANCMSSSAVSVYSLECLNFKCLYVPVYLSSVVGIFVCLYALSLCLKLGVFGNLVKLSICFIDGVNWFSSFRVFPETAQKELSWKL